MNNCKLCNDKGYVFDTNDNLALCRCRIHDRWAEYLRPLCALVPPSKKKIKPAKLINCNQVITGTVENMAGLMNFMLSVWFPEDFIITSLEEINAISFKRHDTFKSIHEFASACKYFIVDMTIINTLRAKSSGWNNKDSMCMLDLVKTIIPTNRKIVIIIKPGTAEFTRRYRELCNGFNELGIEYFNIGKYEKFQINNNSKGSYNE